MSATSGARPQVILLNGTSSVGKTTLARELVARLPEFAYLGVDDFVDRHPDRTQLASIARDGDGGTTLELRPAGRWLMRGFHRAAAATADSGQRLVIDDMMFEPWLLDDWTDVLQPYEVMLVGLHCSLDELERREGCRSDRDPGFARGHLARVHQCMTYDVELHTDRSSVAQCADEICQRWSLR
jgi:chloramphenicol 3-O phosphotransferase